MRHLHIFYRHLPTRAKDNSRDPNKVRPSWFSYEACFRNLIATIAGDPNGSRVTVTIMFDGTLEEYQNDFCSKYDGNGQVDIRLQLLTGGSDRYSSMITLNYANSQQLPDSDLLYFLENDYMHQPGWVSKVFELFDSVGVDIVSLYDHADKYHQGMYPGLAAQIVPTATHHWRTTPSTCGSYILSKGSLTRDWGVFTMWLDDYHFFGKYVGELGRVLLTPIPGLSTHCMTGYLSPAIAWEGALV